MSLQVPSRCVIYCSTWRHTPRVTRTYSVKEVTLATEALGRAADYDPRTDSTVRVTASRLRAKLTDYFAQEGAKDPVLIAVPKGSYSIVCSYRGPEASADPAEGASRAAKSIGVRWLVIAIVASFGLAAGFLPGFWAGRRSARPVVPAASARFWNHFLQAGDPPIVVYSNARFIGAPTTGLRYPAADNKEPVNTVFTGVGEVIAVMNVSHQLSVFNRDVRVKRAQLFTWDDAHTADLILVGGQRQNTTLSQLPPLEKFNLKAYSEEPHFGHGAVRNEAPVAGKEEPYYFCSGDHENGLEYAIVALTQGVSAGRRVLILAGVRTFGTQAAAEFVSNPAMIEELSQRLNVRGHTFPTFECLIEVPVRGGTPLAPRLLLAHRRKDATGD